MHTFSQLTHTCVDENVMGGGGSVCRHGLAWLGWDALPLPLTPPPTPQGAVEDQIRTGSQIRISLIVECLRMMDGYGTEMGPESLRDPPIS